MSGFNLWCQVAEVSSVFYAYVTLTCYSLYYSTKTILHILTNGNQSHSCAYFVYRSYFPISFSWNQWEHSSPFFLSLQQHESLTFCIRLFPDPWTSYLCPPVGLNSSDPDKEDEPAPHIGTSFITDRFSLRFQRHMYNTDQCNNDGENEKEQEGKEGERWHWERLTGKWCPRWELGEDAGKVFNEAEICWWSWNFLKKKKNN